MRFIPVDDAREVLAVGLEGSQPPRNSYFSSHEPGPTGLVASQPQV